MILAEEAARIVFNLFHLSEIDVKNMVFVGSLLLCNNHRYTTSNKQRIMSKP